MILIITHKTDFTADFVINKLNQRKIPYKRLNCEDIFINDYSIKIFKDFKYSILGINNYKSVWFRRTKLPEIKGLRREEQIYILSETESLFENLFVSLDVNWLSSPSDVYKAENKLLQLKTAIKLGFNIPKTIITNSKKELLEFYSNCNGNIILKPISQTRIQYKEGSAFIFTNPISEYFIKHMAEYDLTPCIYQENIEKEYEIRVTVVGESVFSAVVFSQTDEETKQDWRKKKLEFQQIEIPKYLEQLCIKLLQKLNIKFGAIDLIKTQKGDYVFLEINPNGQWAWIETQTGQKISDAIINYLIQ